MKLLAAAALACGFVVAPMVSSAIASAVPGWCDGADCVPYVDRGAVQGESCTQNTRYNFGIDAGGNTLACSSRSQWIASPPLVGMRTLRSLCGQETGVAQSPDGVPLSCIDGAWTADYSAVFYQR
jgi:hypothetical protein